MDKQELKGMLDQAKGVVKEQIGRLTNDPSKEADGKMDQVKGKWKEDIGKAKDTFSRD